MNAQVLANELRQPEGGLLVVHFSVGLALVAGRLQVRQVPAVSFCSHLGDVLMEAVLKVEGCGFIVASRSGW
jgi:hypothetical protein